MAKRKRGGGRKRGFRVTPKSLVKIGVAATAVKLAIDGNAIKETSYILTHAGDIYKEGTGSMKTHAKQLVTAALPAVVVATVGPKLVDAGFRILGKSSPAVNRVANATIVKV